MSAASTETNKEEPTNGGDDDTPFYDVVIVGAGVAGTSAAFHLLGCSAKKVLIVDASLQAGEGIRPRHSGSATMPLSGGCIKMMVQIFAGSCKDFMRHHSDIGAQRYLRATQQGLQLQKGIAKLVFEQENVSSKDTIKELGSYYVAYKEDEADLKMEFETLKSFGDPCRDVEWCDRDRLANVEGLPSGFHCAIYFPKDAVIDSSFYAKTLLEYVQCQSNNDKQMDFWSNTRVTDVRDKMCTNNDDSGYALVTMESIGAKTEQKRLSKQVRAKHVIMATGGLYKDPQLHGLIKPCYSYLVHVPVETYTATHPVVDSPNFFTWGFSHDWCFTNGKIRCSGEDHFSAYKDPHVKQRCRNLSQWSLEHYGCRDDPSKVGEDDFFNAIPQQYGIYSDTPDMVPLIGHLSCNNDENTTSRVCYLLGCNAWGQTILSYCASLVPGLLGYKELTSDQKDILRLFSIRRFANHSD